MAIAPEMANNAGEPEDEELMDVPEEEKASDPLFAANVRRVLDGQVYHGKVEEIEMGVVTREKLYRIRYDDGDMEHFSAELVLKCMEPTGGNATQLLKRPADASADMPIAKRPAGATAHESASAAAASDGDVDAEDEEHDQTDTLEKLAAGAKSQPVFDEADEQENDEEEEDEEMEQESSALKKMASAKIAKKPSADAGDEEHAKSMLKKPATALLKKPAADDGDVDMEEEHESPPPIMKKPASRGAR